MVTGELSHEQVASYEMFGSWRNQWIYVKVLLTQREYERNTWHKWAY